LGAIGSPQLTQQSLRGERGREVQVGEIEA
jgi:hypothetical protein